MFEDVFSNLRSVPLCFFSGSNVFDGFLRDYYMGSIAEHFVERGHYNITFGRREGPRFDYIDIVEGTRLKSDVRMVMALYWGRVVRECPDCLSALSITTAETITW